MPLLIKLDNKRWWDKPEWLTKGDVPAQALLDFKLENNELSVWHVESNGSNLDRVLTALAANRDFIDKIDYAVLDEKVVADWDIKLRKTPGISPDDYASKEWHRDLTELTGLKLLGLATEIVDLIKRKQPAMVKALLATAAEEGRINKDLMKQSLAAKFKWPAPPS